MSYFKKHVFFCTNLRNDGKKCCQNNDASDMRLYAKQRIQALGLWGKGNIRISTSGCLGHCQQGPTIVIYPEAVWYTYRNREDIDEIIENHLLKNQIVEHLLMDRSHEQDQ